MIRGIIKKGARLQQRFPNLTDEDRYVTVGYVLLGAYFFLNALYAFPYDPLITCIMLVHAAGLFMISFFFMGRLELCLQIALGWNFLMLLAIMEAGREFVHIGSIWFLTLSVGFFGVSSLRYMLISSLLSAAGIAIVNSRALPSDPVWQHPLTLLNLLGVLLVMTLCGYMLISARKKKEVELKRALEETNRISREIQIANEKLQASEWIKARLLSTMSHEMRTPMMAMQTASENLQHADLSAPMRRSAIAVGRAASSATHTLNDILLLREIEMEKGATTYIRFSLYELIEEVCRVVQFSSPGQVSGVLDILPDMPACVMGNQRRLRQVLHSILRHILSHSGSDLLRITVRSLGLTRLRFEIQIWGAQIKKDEIGQALEGLGQERADEDTAGELSLSITRQFIQSVDGRAEVNTRLENAVNFTLEIPCAPAGTETIGEILPPPNVQTSRFETSGFVLDAMQPWLDYWGMDEKPELQCAARPEGILTPRMFRQLFADEGTTRNTDSALTSQKGTRFSLLLIEDDPVLNEVLSSFFSEKGFWIKGAKSSAEAKEALTSETFDVMISDVSIPGEMNGLDLVRFAAEREGRSPVMCVLSGLRKHQKEALENGADGFFVKPASLDELHSFILQKLHQ